MSSYKYKLGIFFDCSGSLAEYERKHVLDYLFSLISETLNHFNNTNIECLFYSWNQDITEINLGHRFSPQGKAMLPILAQKIKELEDEDINVFLIITDGSHKKSDQKKFSETLKTSKSFISCVLVGNKDLDSVKFLTKQTQAFPADSLLLFLSQLTKIMVDKEVSQ